MILIEMKKEDVYVIEGTFVDRMLNAVNVNEPDSLNISIKY